ncbi:MAG TPA: phosphoribosylamine--glycine ligase [Candidatus Sumerlaeota bacterium]|nr:phosphoribosylamine--glycine ligase [Candidatus Sumerlaeota bacterium]HPK02047.1 phosphoribosylamine--glycine ligase [Candidatus Sumerlaeota bacterium]
MRILIVGGGGREHALAWKIARSPLCDKLFCAPGNPGIGRVAQCVPIPLGPPFHELTAWCREQAIDLVVIGPERPLADGIVDALAGAGIKAFGPTRDGAQLEASKTFAKDLMREAGIPTAQARTFSNLDAALAALDDGPPPYVIKAVGLAEGKGVTVARTRAEAEDALRRCLCDRVFGQAGAEVLIEEFLAGEEASLLAFTDGRVIQAMDSAQDHKPLLDGDQGPNTGGMGAYSPAPVVTPAIFRQCVAHVLEPCLAALRRRGIDYRGVIYAGLMITADGPRVVEFNCRFGDPETQALLPRLQNDLVEVLLACVEGRLAGIQLRWRDDAAVCVVAASGGYPGPYPRGKAISGLDSVAEDDRTVVFHAGTALDASGRVVTAGGRVLGITACDDSLRAAIDRCYAVARQIHFDGMHYRTDIGRKALDRLD